MTRRLSMYQRLRLMQSNVTGLVQGFASFGRALDSHTATLRWQDTEIRTLRARGLEQQNALNTVIARIHDLEAQQLPAAPCLPLGDTALQRIPEGITEITLASGSTTTGYTAFTPANDIEFDLSGLDLVGRD